MPNDFKVRVTKMKDDQLLSFLLDDRFFHDENDAKNAGSMVFASDEAIKLVEIFKAGVPTPIVVLDR